MWFPRRESMTGGGGLASREAPRSTIRTRICAGAMFTLGLAAAAPTASLAGNFPAEIDLSTLNGADGFILDGSIDEYSGFSISAAGDVNGDGISDIVIGAPGVGASYVVFGTDQGFPARSSLSTLDGTDGFAIAGAGSAVSGAGDVNGDGIDDVMVTAPWFNTSYVVFGSDQGFPAVFDLSTLDGTNGFALNRAEYDVSGAGDVNGDGFGDVIVGQTSEGANFAGRAYVVFGSGAAFPPLVDVGMLDGSNGFALEGVDVLGAFGFSVSGAGDFNADGIDDIIVGTGIPGSHPSGAAFVVFGTDQGFPAVLRMADLNGASGLRLFGVADGDHNVSGAGDVNGDGVDDVIIGAPYAAGPNGEPQTGQSYVVFGFREEMPAGLSLAALDGTNGFALDGFDPGGAAGFAVSGAGDVNADGFDDVIVGAYPASPGGLAAAGQSYVVFGSGQGFPARIALSGLDGSNGFALSGGSAGDISGYTVSGAGDINADGIGDVMVGAPGANAFDGQTYVVFGRPAVSAPSLTVSGACPGEVTIEYSEATPNGAVVPLHADTQGTFVIPSGRCAGTVIDLADPKRLSPWAADETGTVLETVTVPPSACGRFLQVIDAATCTTSNVAQLP